MARAIDKQNAIEVPGIAGIQAHAGLRTNRMSARQHEQNKKAHVQRRPNPAFARELLRPPPDRHQNTQESMLAAGWKNGMREKEGERELPRFRP